SDGTRSGTVPIPGPEGEPGHRERWSYGRRCGSWSVLSRRVEESAESFHEELWRTDGSPGSTRRLAALPSNRTANLSLLTEWNGRCVFVVGDLSSSSLAPEETGGPAFWVSDGSPAGTRELFSLPA